ncbi:hypothetical protein LguiA_005095 [Lonicera macranthoides]
MENFSGIAIEGDHIELPLGFRFHPFDEELITHYLSNKVLDINFSARAIGEVDMNKVGPWELAYKQTIPILNGSTDSIANHKPRIDCTECIIQILTE